MVCPLFPAAVSAVRNIAHARFFSISGGRMPSGLAKVYRPGAVAPCGNEGGGLEKSAGTISRDGA
jgi:hypothetical protein